MKRFVGIILIFSVLFCTLPCMTLTGSAASPIKNIYVNGKALEFSEAERPFLQVEGDEGITMVPLRAISEALGATVYWFNSDKKIQIVRYDTTLRLFIGLPDMDIWKPEGSSMKMVEKKKLSAPAFQGDESRDFRTFVPLRAIFEAFNADVNAKFDENDTSEVDRAMNIYILDDYDETKENVVSIAELYDTNEISDSTLISTEGIISKIGSTYYLQDENEPFKMITFTEIPDAENFWTQQLGVKDNNPIGSKVKVTGMVKLEGDTYSMPLTRAITGLRLIEE